MLRDPFRKRRVDLRCEPHNRALQQRAVVGEVVAAQRSERRGAVVHALPQPGHEVADGALWSCGMGDIVRDVRMREVERVAGQAIAFLGDGQRDQAYCRVGKAREHGSVFVCGAEHLADGPDDAQLRVFVEQGEGVQALLRT